MIINPDNRGDGRRARIRLETPTSSATLAVTIGTPSKYGRHAVTVEWRDGRTVTYGRVPDSVASGLARTIIDGGSVGQYVNRYVRPYAFTYKR